MKLHDGLHLVAELRAPTAAPRIIQHSFSGKQLVLDRKQILLYTQSVLGLSPCYFTGSGYSRKEFFSFTRGCLPSVSRMTYPSIRTLAIMRRSPAYFGLFLSILTKNCGHKETFDNYEGVIVDRAMLHNY